MKISEILFVKLTTFKEDVIPITESLQLYLTTEAKNDFKNWTKEGLEYLLTNSQNIPYTILKKAESAFYKRFGR